MKIIDITQRSARWHRWRAQGVTASEATIVLSRSPHQTPWRLWAERTGFAPAADLSANPHVQRGVALEDAARQAFEARHATLLLPVCGESETHPVLRASFDGIADDGAPVELKAPCAKRFAEVAAQGIQSETFRLYWPQVQHQLFVADAALGWLVFYAEGAELIEFPVPRDEAFLTDELVPKCLAFWELIATRRPPELDPARDLYQPAGEALDHWAILAGQYRERLREKARLDGLVKETAVELDTLQRALVGLMGAFRLGEAAGLRVTRYLQSGAIDYGKALQALCPDVDVCVLEAYRKKSAERVRITPVTEGAASAHAPVPIAEPRGEAVASFFF
jgi:putative phage-type endonuclease